ncbi:MAG: flagellar biosynthesis protein FlhA [Fibrobacteres bacterium]|nr:flagellar biosynthesis protein FlhA [Fibrobacterota bacterium]
MEALGKAQGIVGKIVRNNDYLVAAGVVGVLCIMLIPMHPLLLDILLSANISLSLLILMVSMYTKRTVDFSVFPGLLLVITLYRLSLNVASTRLILAEGEAGSVINAFGTFVTSGNIVVGTIIFIILVVIQFVVITKGSSRIAEVAARFTLDAMPGKQMAVDADLNAGMITEAEARERRDTIRREADFYGAMDGASKFVRGDAVAGLVMTSINVVGGFIIGMLQFDLSFQDSLTRFTVLTIGDGLVTQVPALLVSTASGLIVTRAASASNLGSEITGQLLQSPKALFIASGIMGLFALVPGFPTIPFLGLSAFAGIAGYMVKNGLMDTKSAEDKEKEAKAAVSNKEKAKAEERIEDYLNVDQMEMEIGYGLIPLVDLSQGGDLLERITMIRRQCASEIGIIVPPIRIRDNIQLKPNEYKIKIKNTIIAGGELMSGSYLAMNPGSVSKELRGIPTKEPAFGLPAIWITESQKEEAELAGYTVVELPAVIATHLTEIIKSHAQEILTRQDIKTLIGNLKERNPVVVDELIPNKMTNGDVQKVLVNLLKERVSIRDLGSILEVLADNIEKTKDTDVLTEFVRDSLSRQICDQYRDPSGAIGVITLDPRLEQLLEVSMQKTDRGSKLVLRSEMASKILEAVNEEVLRVMSKNEQPVILTSPIVRSQFRKMTEPSVPGAAILSYNEIASGINIRSIGMIKVKE